MQVRQKMMLSAYVLVMLLGLALIPICASGQTGVVIPLDEAKFESPVLPPPLWFTNEVVMKELALLSIKSRQEREAETAGQWRHRPRVAAGALSVTHVAGDFGSIQLEDSLLGSDFERFHHLDYDGQIFSTFFKMSWDRDRYTLGVIVPYQRLDFDSFDAHRIGAMAFGSYTLPIASVLNQQLFLKFIVNGNYIYNEIDSNIVVVRNLSSNKRGFQDFSTFGGNITVALGFDTQDFYRSLSTQKDTIFSLLSLSWSIAISYQFNDDADVVRESVQGRRIVDEVDTQHLFMIGANAGVRIRDRVALALYGIWNHDASDYKGFTARDADENYFDLMLQATVSIWPELSLNGGYKKVLGYKDFDVDQIFLGVAYRF